MPRSVKSGVGVRLLAVILFGLLTKVAAPTPANAGVVVNWGGRYVSQSELYSGSDANYVGPSDIYGDGIDDFSYGTGTISGRLVDNEVRYDPNNDSYNGTSKEFYGGHAVVYDKLPNRGLTDLSIVNQGNHDAMHIEAKADANITQAAVLTYWKSDDFLIDADSYAMNEASVFSIESTQDSNDNTPGVHMLRWVVRNGDQFYLSGNIATGWEDFRNNGTYTTSYSSIQFWTEYDPFRIQTQESSDSQISSVLLNDGYGTAYDQSDINNHIDFNNVTAVGFYVEFLRPAGKNGAISIDYKVKSFSADLDPNGNAVPEPSTFALGLIGVTGAAVRRLRKRRGAKAEETPGEPAAEPRPEIAL